MKMTKYELCDSCREICLFTSSEGIDISIEDFLDGNGYNQPLGYLMGNQMVLQCLQEDGGCSRCITLFELAIE